MRFGTTPLRALQAMAYGAKTPKEIAKRTDTSYAQTAKALAALEDADLITRKRKHATPTKHRHTALLLQTLAEHKHLPESLAHSALPILEHARTPHSAKEIAERTGLSRQMVHRTLKQLLAKSIVKKDGPRYAVNQQLWPRLAAFLDAHTSHQAVVDERTPPGAIIHRKDENEIVFSTKQDVDATPTAFSAFDELGIPIHDTTNHYTLPKRTLTKHDVLKDCLSVLETDYTTQRFILTALLAKKHSLKTSHPLLDTLERILAGEQIRGYPTRSEIAERAQMYGVRL